LMGRIVKEFPIVQELLVTRVVKQPPLIVSRASYERRRAELEEIVTKKLPALSKEIAQARSYGDLRENFEYKAAKHQQRLLLRRRGELDYLLRKAQPTDFADVTTDTVQIGTTVTLTDLNTGKTLTYHILGAWDGDPARNIVSYPAALAQAMLGKRPGDIVETADDSGPLRLRIERIEKTPPEILQSL
ncbi:MAG: GreA/GreB family elongation factor, partial [Verrucomicrobiae bacterium]|nr:GreA/GreB family elongation factor [Verrucomicrobiae bacterium]